MTAAIAYSTPAISRSQIVEKPCLLNLLIFSQDRALCHAYNEAASALGYTAATSGTAEQALYLIDSQKVDVVLLDKNPPAAHELEMLQKIKSRHPEIELIVDELWNSGFSGSDDEGRRLRLPHQAFWSCRPEAGFGESCRSSPSQN